MSDVVAVIYYKITKYSFLSLLQAYSVYDEEIGYCQGQSFLAAVLLLHVSKHVVHLYINPAL